MYARPLALCDACGKDVSRYGLSCRNCGHPPFIFSTLQYILLADVLGGCFAIWIMHESLLDILDLLYEISNLILAQGH